MKEKNIQCILDIGATLGSIVPMLGGFLSTILSNMSVDRKLKNIKLAIDSLEGKYREPVNYDLMNYLKTHEFLSLFESALTKVADEPKEEMVKIYGAWIDDTLSHPNEDNAIKAEFLNSIERERETHIKNLQSEKIGNKPLSYQDVGNYYRRAIKKHGGHSSLSNAADVARQRNHDRRIDQKLKVARKGGALAKLIFDDDPSY